MEIQFPFPQFAKWNKEPIPVPFIILRFCESSFTSWLSLYNLNKGSSRSTPSS